MLGESESGVPNAPLHELTRSPAAAVVGALASRSGLLLSHFEHRARLPLPDAWLPHWASDPPASWSAGVLAESKYVHFAHDNPIGSFHPGHRAKWTAHELCHALVGFAWRPDASPLWLSLAARLAEALPVALYYFHDEAGLRRCADHAGGGPLYTAFCGACEAAAAQGPVEDLEATRHHAAGRAFVERELAAVSRARRLGRPVESRHGTLDLSSDGLTWQAAHRPRLASPEFAEYVERFASRDGGWHAQLDDLEARILELQAAICGEGEAAPLRGGRARWVAHDLGWRLLQIRAECEREPAEALTVLIETLAEGRDEAAVHAAAEGYEALFEDWILPDPETVFATGYDLPGGRGRSVVQVAEGLWSACPATLTALDAGLAEVVADFVAADEPARRPLGWRFAEWLATRRPGPVADLAAYEAALAHPPPPDPAGATLGSVGQVGAPVAANPGVRVLCPETDVASWAEALLELDEGEPLPPAPAGLGRGLAIGRVDPGDLVVVDLSAEAAEALQRLAASGPTPPEALGLPGEVLAELRALGLLLPTAWSL